MVRSNFFLTLEGFKKERYKSTKNLTSEWNHSVTCQIVPLTLTRKGTKPCEGDLIQFNLLITKNTFTQFHSVLSATGCPLHRTELKLEEFHNKYRIWTNSDFIFSKYNYFKVRFCN